MFRHKGNTRTFGHNLKLASSLSFVAGIVNICGLFAFATLTTNVTGHFGYFADEIVKNEYSKAIIYINYILFFLLGAFFSSLMSEYFLKKHPKAPHFLPLTIEFILLTLVGFSDVFFTNPKDFFIIGSYILLFTMGLQNALVTKVSQSIVRTTHLTGLFTDLGIELSQLFFYTKTAEKNKLFKSIYLKLSIIMFFFLGGIMGGFVYQELKLRTLLLASIVIILILFMDYFTIHYFSLKRKFRRKT
ncbi:YoaK family protein [Flavobacterium sp.]